MHIYKSKILTATLATVILSLPVFSSLLSSKLNPQVNAWSGPSTKIVSKCTHHHKTGNFSESDTVKAKGYNFSDDSDYRWTITKTDEPSQGTQVSDGKFSLGRHDSSFCITIWENAQCTADDNKSEYKLQIEKKGKHSWSKYSSDTFSVTCKDNGGEEPDPTPTPEPEPESALNIDFAFDDRPCDNNFTARYTIEEDGEAITDLKVRFTYAGMVKEATTNSDGRAEVTFTNHGEDTLTAEPDKGYPKKEMTYVQGDNSHCEPSEDEGDDEGEVLGATDEGYTLGAYAPAGTFDQILMHSVGILGTTLTTAGATLHLKKRFNK